MKRAQHSVGYESLSQAALPLLSDAKTVDETLGFILALALHDFSLSSLFEITDETDYESIDRRLQDLAPRLSTIHHVGAVRVLYTSINALAQDGEKTSFRRYYIYRTLERLSAHNHRNFAVLNNLYLVGSLFDVYQSTRSKKREESDVDGGGESPGPASSPAPNLTVIPKPERQVILKLLKRLLELGSSSEEARQMFQKALREDESLNGDVLEVLRAGMKTRWPEHFSLEGPSALVVPCEPSKSLPSTGFTFMVRSVTVGSGIDTESFHCRYGCGWKLSRSSGLIPYLRSGSERA